MTKEINTLEKIAKESANQLRIIKQNFKLLNTTQHTLEIIEIRSNLNTIMEEMLPITDSIKRNQDRI